MSVRHTDKDKREDPWYRRLGRDERDVLEWIFDHCDDAGFLELDEEVIAEETKIGDVGKVEASIERLQKSYKGVRKVIVRGAPGVEEGSTTAGTGVGAGVGEYCLRAEGEEYKVRILWAVNYIKFQQLRRKTCLNPKYDYHFKIIAVLEKMKPLFPEVMIYMAGVGQGWGRALEEKSRVEKRRVLKEEEKSKSISDNSDYVPTHDDSLYSQLIEEKILIKWESWLQLRQSYPDKDTNWPGVVNHVIQSNLNSTKGIDMPWNFVNALCKNGKFMHKSPGMRPGKQTEYDKRKGDINKLHTAGKIDDDECRRLIKKAKEEFGR